MKMNFVCNGHTLAEMKRPPHTGECKGCGRVGQKILSVFSFLYYSPTPCDRFALKANTILDFTAIKLIL